MPIGSVRVLFRSRITSDGFALRMAASAASADRANVTATPSWFAAVLIFDENIKSSSTATIMILMILESQAVGPFFKNGFIVGCETTREAVLIDPGDEDESLLAVALREKVAIKHILLTHAH